MSNIDLQTPFIDSLSAGTPNPDAVDMDPIMAALTGELPLEERLAVIDRCAVDRSWAAAWQQAKQMIEVRDEPAPDAIVPANRPFPLRALIVAVAVAVAASTIGFLLVGSPDTPSYRSAQSSTVEVVSAAALPRSKALLEWTGVPDGAQVVLTIQDTHLATLTTTTGLDLHSYLLPEAMLEGLPDQAELLWNLEITTQEGRIEQSPTFRTTLLD